MCATLYITMVPPYKECSIYIGDPVSVGVEKEWQEALRLYTYNQDNELFLHSKSSIYDRWLC